MLDQYVPSEKYAKRFAKTIKRVARQTLAGHDRETVEKIIKTGTLLSFLMGAIDDNSLTTGPAAENK
jgi:hypothetical protein